MTQARLERLLTDHGYELFEAPGFVNGIRDGKRVSLFTWSNDIWANVELIPRKYLVVDCNAGRIRIPMVRWERFLPVSEQTARAWADVAGEFAAVIERGEATGERHSLDDTLGAAIVRAGFRPGRPKKGALHVATQAGPLIFTVAERTLTASYSAGASEAFALHANAEWDDVTAWLRGLPH